jgi:surface antigen
MLSVTRAEAMNCVAYVKAVSNFSLMGDAWAWWDAAANVYDRGRRPESGAVMVFSRTARMRVGHVALVTAVRGPREILINQANWHHGRVDTGVSVIDISPDNDWSLVNVEWSPHVYGGPFPITGFVYGAHAARPSPRFASPHFVLARMPATPPRLTLASLSRTNSRPAAFRHPATVRKLPARSDAKSASARGSVVAATLSMPVSSHLEMASAGDFDRMLSPASLLHQP